VIWIFYGRPLHLLFKVEHLQYRLRSVIALPASSGPSDNAVAFFSFWNPSELSRIREPFIMRVVTIEADERRRMNNENTRRGGSAAHRRGPSRSKLQQELAELAAQKAAISEVLRAIASSPHDLQPIFQSIIDSAVRLCRGGGVPTVLSRKQAFVSLPIH
jgi:hypothetical protein